MYSTIFIFLVFLRLAPGLSLICGLLLPCGRVPSISSRTYVRILFVIVLLSKSSSDAIRIICVWSKDIGCWFSRCTLTSTINIIIALYCYIYYFLGYLPKHCSCSSIGAILCLFCFSFVICSCTGMPLFVFSSLLPRPLSSSI